MRKTLRWRSMMWSGYPNRTIRNAVEKQRSVGKKERNRKWDEIGYNGPLWERRCHQIYSRELGPTDRTCRWSTCGLEGTERRRTLREGEKWGSCAISRATRRMHGVTSNCLYLSPFPPPPLPFFLSVCPSFIRPYPIVHFVSCLRNVPGASFLRLYSREIHVQPSRAGWLGPRRGWFTVYYCVLSGQMTIAIPSQNLSH